MLDPVFRFTHVSIQRRKAPLINPYQMVLRMCTLDHWGRPRPRGFVVYNNYEDRLLCGTSAAYLFTHLRLDKHYRSMTQRGPPVADDLSRSSPRSRHSRRALLPSFLPSFVHSCARSLFQSQFSTDMLPARLGTARQFVGSTKIEKMTRCLKPHATRQVLSRSSAPVTTTTTIAALAQSR